MNVSLFLEIKNEYTEHLVDTLTPFIYEGLSSLYKEADKIASGSGVANNKTLLIFQKLLQTIDRWNQNEIDKETNRIKQSSGTSEYLDDLVKAVIKSNIILLTYSNTISNLIAQSYYNSLTTSSLVHRCYVECAKDAHNFPFLFFHDTTPIEFKRNQIIIQQNIQSAIIRAIRKLLPISIILKEFLINSANIINEPPKVELMGSLPINVPDPENILNKPMSEKKIDPKIEKEVMNIIRSDNIKSEKQKIQAIMNIDKLITSMEPNELTANRRHQHIMQEHNQKNIPEHLINMDNRAQNQHKKNSATESESTNYANYALNKSDKKIININLDGSATNGGSKTVSGTSMTSSNYVQRIGADVSERVDPRNVDYIEEYGTESQFGGNQNNKKKYR